MSSRIRRALPITALALVALFTPGWLDPVRDENSRGLRAYEEKRFDEALTSFLRAEEKAPDKAVLSLNSAAALYQQKRYEEALAAFERSKEDPTAGPSSFYGAGNVLFQMGKLPEAAELYKQALRRDPNDIDAKHNLELVEKRIEEQREQQQQAGEGDQQKKEQPKPDSEQDPSQEKQEDEQPGGEEREQNPPPAGEEPPETSRPEGKKQQPSDLKISPEEAERILSALAEEEEELRRESMEKLRMKRKPGAKDW